MWQNSNSLALYPFPVPYNIWSCTIQPHYLVPTIPTQFLSNNSISESPQTCTFESCRTSTPKIEQGTPQVATPTPAKPPLQQQLKKDEKAKVPKIRMEASFEKKPQKKYRNVPSNLMKMFVSHLYHHPHP